VHNLKNKAEFDSAMETKDTLMVLDCFATWCGPCKVIAPQVVKYVTPHTPAIPSCTDIRAQVLRRLH